MIFIMKIILLKCFHILEIKVLQQHTIIVENNLTMNIIYLVNMKMLIWTVLVNNKIIININYTMHPEDLARHIKYNKIKVILI